jgi:hypothetical protein
MVFDINSLQEKPPEQKEIGLNLLEPLVLGIDPTPNRNTPLHFLQTPKQSVKVNHVSWLV